MKIISRKSKMVSFRVAPDEYDKLRTACMAHGLASVSELARAAMDRVIAGGVTSGWSFDEQLRDLRDRVQALTTEIDRLAQCVEAEAPRETPPVPPGALSASASD